MPPKTFRHSNRVGNVTRFTLFLGTAVAILFSQLAAAREMTSEPRSGPSTRIFISATLPLGQVGAAYSGAVTARGGTAPYTFRTNGTLPPGISLDPSPGLVSPAPSPAGSLYFAAAPTHPPGTGPH